MGCPRLRGRRRNTGGAAFRRCAGGFERGPAPGARGGSRPSGGDPGPGRRRDDRCDGDPGSFRALGSAAPFGQPAPGPPAHHDRTGSVGRAGLVGRVPDRRHHPGRSGGARGSAPIGSVPSGGGVRVERGVVSRAVVDHHRPAVDVAALAGCGGGDRPDRLRASDPLGAIGDQGFGGGAGGSGRANRRSGARRMVGAVDRSDRLASRLSGTGPQPRVSALGGGHGRDPDGAAHHEHGSACPRHDGGRPAGGDTDLGRLLRSGTALLASGQPRGDPRGRGGDRGRRAWWSRGDGLAHRGRRGRIGRRHRDRPGGELPSAGGVAGDRGGCRRPGDGGIPAGQASDRLGRGLAHPGDFGVPGGESGPDSGGGLPRCGAGRQCPRAGKRPGDPDRRWSRSCSPRERPPPVPGGPRRPGCGHPCPCRPPHRSDLPRRASSGGGVVAGVRPAFHRCLGSAARGCWSGRGAGTAAGDRDRAALERHRCFGGRTGSSLCVSQ